MITAYDGRHLVIEINILLRIMQMGLAGTVMTWSCLTIAQRTPCCSTPVRIQFAR